MADTMTTRPALLRGRLAPKPEAEKLPCRHSTCGYDRCTFRRQEPFEGDTWVED